MKTQSHFTRATLLERVKNQNDSAAWEEFIELYKNYIYVIVRSMSIFEHDADDIVQQVTFKLWKNLCDYQYDPSRARFRTWVRTVTKNEVLSFIRKRKAEVSAFSEHDSRQELLYLDAIKLPEIDRIAEEEWKVFITNTALEVVQHYFSEPVLQVFMLSLDGLTPTEIAERNNMPRRTVYKYISRVKVCLIDEIDNLKHKLGG